MSLKKLIRLRWSLYTKGKELDVSPHSPVVENLSACKCQTDHEQNEIM